MATIIAHQDNSPAQRRVVGFLKIFVNRLERLRIPFDIHILAQDVRQIQQLFDQIVAQGGWGGPHPPDLEVLRTLLVEYIADDLAITNLLHTPPRAESFTPFLRLPYDVQLRVLTYAASPNGPRILELDSNKRFGNVTLPKVSHQSLFSVMNLNRDIRSYFLRDLGYKAITARDLHLHPQAPDSTFGPDSIIMFRPKRDILFINGHSYFGYGNFRAFWTNPYLVGWMNLFDTIAVEHTLLRYELREEEPLRGIILKQLFKLKNLLITSNGESSRQLPGFFKSLAQPEEEWFAERKDSIQALWALRVGDPEEGLSRMRNVRVRFVELVEEEKPLKLSERIEKTFAQLHYPTEPDKWVTEGR